MAASPGNRERSAVSNPSNLTLVRRRGDGNRHPDRTTVDLFCGAGGIAEGFRQAGYRCLYGNDRMQQAIETFSLNHPDAWGDPRDIEDVDAADVRSTLGLDPTDLDVLVGGPPCQGFSINAPERFLDDPRNKLFRHYLRFVEEFRPKAFLFENVPGLLSLGDGRVYGQICGEFERLGYVVTTNILLAAHYGVPQASMAPDPDWIPLLRNSRTGADALRLQQDQLPRRSVADLPARGAAPAVASPARHCRRSHWRSTTASDGRGRGGGWLHHPRPQ